MTSRISGLGSISIPKCTRKFLYHPTIQPSNHPTNPTRLQQRNRPNFCLWDFFWDLRFFRDMRFFKIWDKFLSCDFFLNLGFFWDMSLNFFRKFLWALRFFSNQRFFLRSNFLEIWDFYRSEINFYHLLNFLIDVTWRFP